MTLGKAGARAAGGGTMGDLMPKGPRPAPSETSAKRPRANGRENNLSALIDHCIAAQSIADAAGERFLSYMLAMTLQEARSLRPEDAD